MGAQLESNHETDTRSTENQDTESIALRKCESGDKIVKYNPKPPGRGGDGMRNTG